MDLPKNLIIQSEAFLDALKEVENSVKAGWSKDRQRWFPHGSVEGGTATLAYGHKLTQGEAKNNAVQIGSKTINLKDGLIEAEAHDLFIQDVTTATNRAREEWNRWVKGGKPPAIPSMFDDLPLKFQAVLVNLVFNIGSLWVGGTYDWPKTSQFILARDEQKTRSGAVTTFYNPKTKKRERLTNRARVLYDAVHLAKGGAV